MCTRGHRGRCPSSFVKGMWQAGEAAGPPGTIVAGSCESHYYRRNDWRAGGLAGRKDPAAIEKTTQLEEERMRPEGFEPPTLWFEARCSIQLS